MLHKKVIYNLLWIKQTKEPKILYSKMVQILSLNFLLLNVVLMHMQTIHN